MLLLAIVIVQLEGQHAFGHAHQLHVRPLQPLAGVQGGEHDLVLLAFALRDGREQGNVLRHFQQAFDFGVRAGAGRILDLAPGTLGHPVAKLQHIAPAGGGHAFAVFAVVQVLLVANVGQPVD